MKTASADWLIFQPGVKASEGDSANIVMNTRFHLEEFFAQGEFAGTADLPRFGLAQIDDLEREFAGAEFERGPELLRIVAPRHHVNVRSPSFLEELAPWQWLYFGETYPNLLIHGRVFWTRESYKHEQRSAMSIQ